MVDGYTGCGGLLKDCGEYFFMRIWEGGTIKGYVWKPAKACDPWLTSGFNYCGDSNFLCERCAKRYGLLW